MLYIITIDIKDAARIEIFTQQLSKIGEYISFMPKCYFIKPFSDIKRNDIYQKLKNELTEEDLIMIAETEPQNMSGWLSNSVVDWLKKA